VLYEMLAGRRAFEGEEISDVLAAVLKETPPLDALPPDTPSSIRRLLRRCLEKDRRERLADLGVARLEIKEALAGEPDASARGRTAGGRRRIEPSMVAAVLTVATLAGAGAWWLKPAPARPAPAVARFTVPLPRGSNWSRAGRHVIAISPDGTHVAYTMDSSLFVRALERFEPAPVVSAGDPSEVFFSSDSAWIGFVAGGQMQKVAVTGGAPVPICTCGLVAGATWNAGFVHFAQEGGIFRVPDTGGTPELLIPAQAGERVSRPELLPGGRTMLFTRMGTSQNDAVVVVEDLESHARATLVRGGSDARYVSTGHIVYGRAGELLAIPFDVETLKTEGTPVTLVSGIMEGANVNLATGVLQFDVSATGSLIYATGMNSDAFRLTWVDVAGTQTHVIDEKGAYQYPRLSPDRTRVVFTQRVSGNNDIYVLNLATHAKTRLTTDPSNDASAVWSPDGSRVVYASNRSGQLNLYSRAADGSGSEERLTTSPNAQYPYAWSNDGRTLIFNEQDPKRFFDIYALPMMGDRTPVPLVTSDFDERRPALSPDGKWLAYQSNELNTFEIHVRPYPDVQRRFQASAGGGASPLWAPDMSALFFRQGSQIVRVPITTTPAFKVVGKQETVASGVPDTPFWMSYDLAPGDARFVVLTTDEVPAGPEYRVVLNWFEELKARVGPRR
jgi:serine/threonine-protein kinase